MITTISTLPDSPNRNDPGTFSDRADALLGAMPTLVTELNSFVTEVNTLSFKTACKAATTAAITLSGQQTIDGVSVVGGDRVLVKNQGTAAQNGIYTVSINAWTRAPDMDIAAEVAGSFVPITYGTTQGGKIYYTTFNASTGTLGTTAIPWSSLTEGSITGVGVITPVNGGTGLSGYGVGDLIYSTAATTLTNLAAAASGNVLKSGTAPSWGKVALETDVSGTLPVANGGTGGTLPIANGGTGSNTASTAFTALKQTATDVSTGVVRLASAGEVLAGTESSAVITPLILRQNSLPFNSTLTQALSGLSTYTFTSIPSWAKRITVMVYQASTTQTVGAGVAIQIGNTTLQSSGYQSHLQVVNSGTTGYQSTDSFLISPSGTADNSNFSGHFVLTRMGGESSPYYVATGTNLVSVSSGALSVFAGTVTLSAVMDRLRIFVTNATTFDGGRVNIIYE